MYREIDLSLEDEFKLKEHVNLLVTLDKHQLIENSMESKLSQLDFERIIKQLLLDFGVNKNQFNKDDFYVSTSNFYAFNLIKKWPKWDKRIVNIFGEKFSGKSYF